jgi:DNA polymerase V
MPTTIPFATSIVSAGFPSPAEDFVLEQLDLNDLLIKHPAATFFVRVGGDSMINAGIFDKDILIVDRSLTATHGKIIIAAVNGELTVKRLILQGQKAQLIPENPKYKAITINNSSELKVWGVVTAVIHQP